jgi:hypothetical protein
MGFTQWMCFHIGGGLRDGPFHFSCRFKLGYMDRFSDNLM